MTNIFESKISTYAKYVYLYLEFLAKINRVSQFPLSYRKIAKGCGITHTWANRCLQELKAQGFIHQEIINQSKFYIRIL